MPSPIYQQSQPQNSMLSMITQFRQNPMSVLSQRYNIPPNLTDPNEILQYLLNTQQVSQDQVNRVMQMKNNPQIQQLLR